MIIRFKKQYKHYNGKIFEPGQTPDLSRHLALKLIEQGFAEKATDVKPEETPKEEKEDQIVHVIHHQARDEEE